MDVGGDEWSDEEEERYNSSSSSDEGRPDQSVTLRNKGSIGFVKAKAKRQFDEEDEVDDSEDEPTAASNVSTSSRQGKRKEVSSREYDDDFKMDFGDDDAPEFRPSFARTAQGEQEPYQAQYPIFRASTMTHNSMNNPTEEEDYRPSFRSVTSNDPKTDSGSSSHSPSFVRFAHSTSEQPRDASSLSSSNTQDVFGRDIPRTNAEPTRKEAKDAANHEMKMMLKAKMRDQLTSNPVRLNMDQAVERLTPAAPRSTSMTPQTASAPRTSNSTGFAGWVQRYMEKFNFSGRLGKHGQGIAAPIEVKVRDQGVGLGSIEEASSLPANRANTEHFDRLRREAVQKEARERKLVEEQVELAKLWRKRSATGEPLSGYSSTEIAKAIHEETVGDRTLAGINRALLFWTERAESMKREISVGEALAQMKRKEREDNIQEVRTISEKTSSLARMIGVLMAFRDETIAPSAVKALLLSLQEKFSTNVLEDYELQRLPALIIRSCVQKYWDLDQDRCLDMVDAVSEVCNDSQNAFFNSSNSGILSTLMRCVVPKLTQAAEEWHLNDPTQIPLHLLYLPWLPHLLPALDAVLVAPVKALERELTKNWTDLTLMSQLKEVVQPWRDVCGGSEFVHELMARSFGSKLFTAQDLRLISAWHSEDLLSNEDFACAAEGALQRFVRESEFTHALDQFRIARAARLYADVKALFPIRILQDSCCRGRIRHLFQYALELIRSKMDGKPVDPGLAYAIEPEPISFSDAWYRNRANTAKPVQVAADFTPAASLQRTIESMAEVQGKDFYEYPGGRKVDGKKVYVVGEKVYCYFDVGVIFASKTMKDWAPVSIDKLMEMV